MIFGYATDRLGRKKLFTWTLVLYLAPTLATAFSWSFFTYALFRALTGAAIGGEYAAINAFGIGAVLGSGVLILRRHVPESPRWLMIHAHAPEAEKIVGDIETTVREKTGENLEEPGQGITLRVQDKTPVKEIWNYVARKQPERSILALSLMIA